LDGISCHAGRKTILDGISLTINRGEFVGILGPNGAGKSTLMAVMGGRLRPDAGSVRIEDADVWAMGERGRAALRMRIGTVLQLSEYNPMIPMTAREVVAMGRVGQGSLLHRFANNDRSLVEDALVRLGIEKLAGRTYRSLSGGEQQKVQIARALAQRPDLLMLDEPTNGLDMDWQERMVTLIGRLSAPATLGHSGLPVIMTTHLTGHLPPDCRRVLLIKQGRLIFDGPTQEALTEKRLGKLYGCRVGVTECGGRRHCHSVGDLQQ
jgi:ABC-type cobalamin/Fe3+-siderophores transport system ATPase subunit